MLYRTDFVPATTPWGRPCLWPRGYEPGAGHKWAEIGNEVILHSPQAISRPRVTKIADDHREKVSVSARSELLKFAADGRQIRTSDDIEQVLYRLARTPVAGKYAALMPSKARQRYEFRLGPILVTEAAEIGPSTKVYTDNFNRSADLDGSTSSDTLFTWTQNTGNTNSTVATALVIADGDNNYATSAELDTDNAYATSNLVSCTGNSYGWLWIRTNSTNTNGYLLNFGVSNAFEMYRYNGGAYPLLDSDTWAPTAALLTLTADGSSISCTESATSVTLTATNSSESTGSGNRKGGIGGFSNVPSCNFDDYTYQDIVVGGATNRGTPFGHKGTAFNGGRTFHGIIQ